MNLEECRKEIDSIDREIVDAFIRRMKVSEQISEIKKSNGLPVLNQEREKEVIENISSMVQGKYEPYAKELFLMIMELSKKIQEEE